jgi:hypothetical protein
MAHTHFQPAPILINRDEEHLRLLGLYHLVVAGINAVVLLVFFIVPLLLGPGFLSGMNVPVPPGGKAALQEHLIKGMLVMGLVTLILALNGWSIQKRQHYISCLILSCIECLSVPVGMILGVSSILVLRRESVREMFRQAVPAAKTNDPVKS